MKYFFDTEFRQGFTKPLIGKSRYFIELISIGMVDEYGRHYYSISKEFDLKKAWNDDWLRENVLKPIHKYLVEIEDESIFSKTYFSNLYRDFNYKCLKTLIAWYGKDNKQIAAEIFNFVNPDLGFHVSSYSNSELREGGRLFDFFSKHNVIDKDNHYYAQPEFYAYYADYDWVLFCSLFGTMMDLPPGFPMYCRDLKQMIHEYSERLSIYRPTRWAKEDKDDTPEIKYSHLVNCKAYENLKNENEHDALSDAIWNKKLYDYLQTRKFN